MSALGGTRNPGQDVRRGPRGHDRVWALVFVAPAVALAVVFKIIPLLLAFIDSTQVWQGVSATSQFVGLANFERLLSDDGARRTFLNAFLLLLTLPIWVVFPLVLAVLIFERTPGWRLFRALYFIPYIIAPVIVGTMFREILHPTGPVNTILRGVGLNSLALPWLASSSTSLWALGAVALWSFFGLGVITYLAALSTIPHEVLEAASLDGANFRVRVFSLIVPLLRPVISYWTVLASGGILIWLFPIIHSLTEGGPGYASMTPEYLVYLTSFRFVERGYATAMGVVLFIAVALLYLAIVRRLYVDEAGSDN